MTQMTEDHVQKLLDMNFRVLTLLGVATCLVNELTNQPRKVKWFMKAVQAVVYDNKPLPPITD